MAHNVYYEDVEIGQEIPAFERKTDFMNWNRYAAVNDEFVFVHMDDEVGKAAGQGAAFGMGNLRWAYVINALQDWIGDEAEIRELSMQFRAINHKHDCAERARLCQREERRGWRTPRHPRHQRGQSGRSGDRAGHGRRRAPLARGVGAAEPAARGARAPERRGCPPATVPAGLGGSGA